MTRTTECRQRIDEAPAELLAELERLATARQLRIVAGEFRRLCVFGAPDDDVEPCAVDTLARLRDRQLRCARELDAIGRILAVDDSDDGVDLLSRAEALWSLARRLERRRRAILVRLRDDGPGGSD